VNRTRTLRRWALVLMMAVASGWLTGCGGLGGLLGQLPGLLGSLGQGAPAQAGSTPLAPSSTNLGLGQRSLSAPARTP
jgi:hypothetical protein